MGDQYEQIPLANLVEPGGASIADCKTIANKIYFAPGYRMLAASMIAGNARVSDYLSQAPVLITALARNSIPRHADHYALLSKQFAWRAQAEPRLKDLMRVFGLPFPMRKLSGRSVSPGKYYAVMMIATCDPRVIASSTLERSWWQTSWLKGCVAWYDRMKFHHIVPQANVKSARVEWFVFAYSRYIDALKGDALKGMGDATIWRVADFVCSHEVRTGEIPFDEKWTFQQAEAAASRWHSIINARDLERSFQKDHGIGIDYTWSMSPWPDEPITVDGYEFVPLNSGRKVSDQATEMHNCLRSYMGRLVNATRYCAWSVRQPGMPVPIVATLGMTRLFTKKQEVLYTRPRNQWRIDQIEGRRHSRKADDAVHAACKQFFRTAF